MTAARPHRVAAAVAAWIAVTSAGDVSAKPRAAVAPLAPNTDVGVDEHLGVRVPVDLPFTDAAGRQVRLADLLRPDRPLVLVLSYYRCPMLCDLVLSGLSRPVRDLGWTPGREIQLVTVSIDPADTRGAARLKQAAVLQALNRPDAGPGWPFLTGDAARVRALADAVGFRYAYDPRSEQFAHPAVVVMLTPDGRVSRYLYGVDFRLLDLRLAAVEAAQGRTGSFVDRVLLTCFRYEPSARRYGFYVSTVLKGGASAAILSVGALLTVLWRKDARRMRARKDRPEARA
jgi:protein SCO1/2